MCVRRCGTTDSHTLSVGLCVAPLRTEKMDGAPKCNPSKNAPETETTLFQVDCALTSPLSCFRSPAKIVESSADRCSLQGCSHNRYSNRAQSARWPPLRASVMLQAVPGVAPALCSATREHFAPYLSRDKVRAILSNLLLTVTAAWYTGLPSKRCAPTPDTPGSRLFQSKRRRLLPCQARLPLFTKTMFK